MNLKLLITWLAEQKEERILSTPNPKAGLGLCEDIKVLVQNFYESVEMSRKMLKVDEKQISVQKRSTFGNLKEVYEQFKLQFPSIKAGFLKLAELCSQHSWTSGIHAVCVCTIHQKTKLMMIDEKLAEFTAKKIPLKSYEHYIAFIICNPTQSTC